MKLLAIETSGKLCGTCLAENEKIIDKIEQNNGLTHSESLMPLIQKLLEKNNTKITDLDALVCDIGPGSFTGIRIGVATSLAFVDTMPNATYTGVSSLEALAYNVKQNGLICSIIDCKNNNCYFALYNLDNNNYFELISPTATSIQELFETLVNYKNSQITFIGDGVTAYKEEIIANISNAIFLDDLSNNINTSNLALAGFKKICDGNTLELSPMYLKKPQAQRQLENNSSQERHD